MKKLKFLSMFLMIAILLSIVPLPAAALDDPMPESDRVVLLDVNTGNVIYSKNPDEQAAPASLTKIMTVLLAVEAIERGECSLGDAVTATENCTYDLIEDGSTANIVPGETMSLENLMYCALVVSANEACNIIAEYVAGSISAFIDRMNTRASELGCTGTHFANTHGLPADGHYTTASDLSKIALEAVSHEKFMEICNTAEITIDATNTSEARHLTNTNGLISKDSEAYPGYYYEYAKGIKTGHTDAAGYCLISTAEKNGMNFLCVVMGGKASPTTEGTNYGNFSDTINLYNWAFDNYSYRDILKMTDLVKDVPVVMGSEADYVSVHPQDSVRALLPNDDDLQSFVQRITIYNEEAGEDLVAPVEAGEVLGEISIERDGVVYGSSPLIASTSIGLSYSQFISARVKEALSTPIVLIVAVILCGLLLVYLFLVLRYRLSRRKFLKEQKLRKKEAERARRNRDIAAGRSVSQPQAVAARNTPKRRDPVPPPLLRDEPPEEKTSEEQAERDYFNEFFGNK